MKTRIGLGLVVPAAVLLLGSLWLLSLGIRPSDGRELGVWQGLAGAVALLLALGIARFSLHRRLLRLWYLFPALFVLVLIAVPLSVVAGWDRHHMVGGTHWWQMSTGQVVAILAMLFTMSVVLPRFGRGERGGVSALAALLGLTLAAALLSRFNTLFLFFPLLWLTLAATLPAKRLLPVFGASLLLFGGLLAVLLHPNPRRLMLPADPNGLGYQASQALLSIRAGGWSGYGGSLPRIPEWHTDFIVGRLCGVGGLAAGLIVLLLSGVLLAAAWRIVRRQRREPARTLAAGCAALLTVETLLYLAVNTALFPTIAGHYPFLSFGPKLLLLDGLLLGLLLSLAREEDEADGSPASGRRPTVMLAGTWLLLAAAAVRLGIVAVAPAAHEPDHRRGTIFAAGGEVLAEDVQAFDLLAEPRRFRDNEEGVLELLVREAGQDRETLRRRFATALSPSSRTVEIAGARGLAPETAHRALDAARLAGFPGLRLVASHRRQYPHRAAASQVIGLVGGAAGASGIEDTHDKLLSEGGEVVLTLDLHAQEVVEAAMRRAAGTDADAAPLSALVVLADTSGNLKAVAQYPFWDPSDTRRRLSAEYQPRTVTDGVEAAGLLKPLIVATAIDARVTGAEDTIDIEHGRWTISGTRTLSDPPALEGVASIPVADIIPVGSHIGCGKLATQLGKERLAAMLRGFGFGQATGIEIRPDLSGIVRKPSNWDSTTTIDLASTGHSVLASPIQLARAYAALANGGLLPSRMRLVDRVISAKGETTAAPAAAPVRILSEAAARFAAKGLREACLRGIARSAALPDGGVPVAGFPGVGHHFDHTRNGYLQDTASAISLFAGFAPADDHPRYVLVVIIDRPRKKDSAAELFRDIMAQLLPAAAGGR